MEKLANISAFESLQSQSNGQALSEIGVFNARAHSSRFRLKNGDSAILRAEYENGKLTAEVKPNDMEE